MPSVVFLVGSEVPAWLVAAPDRVVETVERAEPGDLIAFLAMDFDIDNDGDGGACEYSEYTAYIRADQVAYVRPPTQKGREALERARG